MTGPVVHDVVFDMPDGSQITVPVGPPTVKPAPTPPVTPPVVTGDNPTPFSGVHRGQLFFREDFLGTKLNQDIWQDTLWFNGSLNGLTQAQYHPSNVVVANSLCTLTLASATSGAIIHSQPMSNAGMLMGYGYIEFLAKLPLNNWWALWTSYSSGNYDEYDIAENGAAGNQPTANHHKWPGNPSPDNDGPFGGGPWSNTAGLIHYGLDRKTDNTVDVWWEGTKVVSGWTALYGANNNFAIANIGVGNANTTVPGQQVIIDHIYAWNPA